MRAQPNISTSAKLPDILPVYVGMEMILTESYLPPRIVRGAPVEVVDIELHPKEPVRDRPSIATLGCCTSCPNVCTCASEAVRNASWFPPPTFLDLASRTWRAYWPCSPSPVS